MNLSEYFKKTLGIGSIAAADSDGNVDIAIYAKPTFTDEENIVIVMADRLIHKYLQSNPKAAYLFREAGEENVGKRFFLTKTKEETDSTKIDAFFEKYKIAPEWRKEAKYLAFFHIDKVLPLIGDKE